MVHEIDVCIDKAAKIALDKYREVGFQLLAVVKGEGHLSDPLIAETESRGRLTLLRNGFPNGTIIDDEAQRLAAMRRNELEDIYGPENVINVLVTDEIAQDYGLKVQESIGYMVRIDSEA